MTPELEKAYGLICETGPQGATTGYLIKYGGFTGNEARDTARVLRRLGLVTAEYRDGRWTWRKAEK